MKALTIIQPFAELIARGDKRVENRKWPTSFRGPLAIHAGKATRYNGERVTDIAAFYGVMRSSLTCGAIIATAEVVNCVRPDDVLRFSRTGHGLPTSQRWLVGHQHVEGPYCFVLDNVRRLNWPLVIDGAQGFWTIDNARINEIGYVPVEAAHV